MHCWDTLSTIEVVMSVRGFNILRVETLSLGELRSGTGPFALRTDSVASGARSLGSGGDALLISATPSAFF